MTETRKSDDEYRGDNKRKSTDQLIQECRDREKRDKPTRLLKEELNNRGVRLNEWDK